MGSCLQGRNILDVGFVEVDLNLADMTAATALAARHALLHSDANSADGNRLGVG
jgi:hypothetical protein